MFSHFSMKYEAVLREQTVYNLHTLKQKKSKNERKFKCNRKVYIDVIIWTYLYRRILSEHKPSVFSTNLIMGVKYNLRRGCVHVSKKITSHNFHYVSQKKKKKTEI